MENSNKCQVTCDCSVQTWRRMSRRCLPWVCPTLALFLLAASAHSQEKLTLGPCQIAGAEPAALHHYRQACHRYHRRRRGGLDGRSVGGFARDRGHSTAPHLEG